MPSWWIVLLASLIATAVMLPFGKIVCLKITKSFSDQDAIRTALDMYRVRNQRYPSSAEGLDALVPEFMKRNSRDPWGYPYVYRTTADDSFVLYSAGAGGLDESGAGDDVTTRDKKYECSTYGVDCGPDPRALGMLLATGSLLLSGIVGLARGMLYLARLLSGKRNVEV
jgi:general secretion pathway protein G